MTKTLKLIALVVVVALAGGLTWWFLRGDPPSEVSLGDAVDAVASADDGDTATPSDADDASDAGDAGDAGDQGASSATVDGTAGTWIVATDQGTFDYSDTATGTFVGFRVDEELARIGAATAVGRTPAVAGELTIDAVTLTEASFTADMAQITTNESRRDDRVHQALDTRQFPEATFVLTEPVELGEAAANGGPVSVTATGDLTIKDITQPITIDIEAQVSGDTLVVVGTTEITFADWDVAVPSAPMVLSAEDTGTLEVQLLLTRA